MALAAAQISAISFCVSGSGGGLVISRAPSQLRLSSAQEMDASGTCSSSTVKPGEMVISEGVQTAASGNVKKGKPVGLLGWVSHSFSPIYRALCSLAAKSSSGKGVSLFLSDPCPAPKRSFFGTDFCGKVLASVPRAAV